MTRSDGKDRICMYLSSTSCPIGLNNVDVSSLKRIPPSSHMDQRRSTFNAQKLSLIYFSCVFSHFPVVLAACNRNAVRVTWKSTLTPFSLEVLGIEQSEARRRSQVPYCLCHKTRLIEWSVIFSFRGKLLNVSTITGRSNEINSS